MKNDYCREFSNLSNWKEEDLAPNVWLHSSVATASHRYSRRSRVRIPLKPWCFQASSFQLLKLENLLWWPFLTLIYDRSLNIGIVSYILHITRIFKASRTRASFRQNNSNLCQTCWPTYIVKKAVSLPNAAASNLLPLKLKPWLSLSKARPAVDSVI